MYALDVNTNDLADFCEANAMGHVARQAMRKGEVKVFSWYVPFSSDALICVLRGLGGYHRYADVLVALVCDADEVNGITEFLNI